MKVALLAGGTGGAKLAAGFQEVLAPGDLTVIANTADDVEIWGLHVSPDVDSVIFRLAGVFNEATGFGIADDTFAALAQMEALGLPAWFRIGDRDLAVHVARTEMLAGGCRLTETALELGRRFGIPSRVLPMADDPVRTWFATDRGALAFQDYYVRERASPRVEAVEYAGLEQARPAPEATLAVGAADLVVIGPSNPVVSVWPVLRVLGAAVERERCVAVSPVVAGAALKGPTVEMMRSLGRDPSAVGVAREYAEVASGFVLDRADAADRAAIEALGFRVLVTDTLMPDLAAAARLAEAILRPR
ncbi:MAG TPA: 2-phospho-L-lactate transferase [Candidatus Dormibacteraeota bacterium]